MPGPKKVWAPIRAKAFYQDKLVPIEWPSRKQLIHAVLGVLAAIYVATGG